MVTWEMPDGTEFRYLGIGVSDAALREFVLRFMSSEGMSWDASTWDDRQLELAFLPAIRRDDQGAAPEGGRSYGPRVPAGDGRGLARRTYRV